MNPLWTLYGPSMDPLLILYGPSMDPYGPSIVPPYRVRHLSEEEFARDVKY